MKTKLLIAICLALQISGFAPKVLGQGATIYISTGDGYVFENDGAASITVERSGNTNTVVTVDYATRDGSAKAGADYTAVTGTLALAAGETEKTISIPLADDDGLVDGDKTFRVCLTNVAAGALIEYPEGIVTIQDNEVPANLDYSFKPVIRGSDSDWDGRIRDLSVLPDGKVLIAGWFTEVNGKPRSGLACFNGDGSLAPTFQTPLSRQDANPVSVSHITTLPDGRVYIAGGFDSVNGAPRPGFARLLPDGSLDESFAPAISAISWFSTVVQPDGKIIAYTDGGLVRVNETGSRDGSFVPTPLTNRNINLFVEHGDGKLLVTDSDGQMIRLNTDGSRDDSFRNVSLGGPASSLLVQTDYKILVAGWFNKDMPGIKLVRLNADGSPDSSFDSGAVVPRYDSQAITLAENGKILLLGWKLGWRLNADGSIDSSFPGFHYGHLDESIELGGSNRGIKAAGAVAYVWGYFSAINGGRVHGLGRVLLNENPRTAMDIQSASAHDPDGSNSGGDYLEAVGEKNGVLRLKVRRLGETTGPATVTFGTRDGTAIGGRHYLSTTATLPFAPQEQEKIVTVPILHNATYDGPRTLELSLTNAVGVASLAPPLIITIFDEEPGFEQGAITRLSDGTTQISVRVLPPTGFRLQASSDLKTWITLWDDWGVLGGSLFKQTFYDANATNLPQRFYRVRTE